MLSKKSFLVFGLSVFSSFSWSSSSSAYEQLFQDHIINDPRVNGDIEKAQAYTDCHMSAMAIFPQVMQLAAYKTADQTGSYEQARADFTKLIGLEMTAKDERKTVINALIEESKAIGEACLAGVDS